MGLTPMTQGFVSVERAARETVEISPRCAEANQRHPTLVFVMTLKWTIDMTLKMNM